MVARSRQAAFIALCLFGAASVQAQAQAQAPAPIPDERAPAAQVHVDAADQALPGPVKIDWRVDNPFRFFNDPADTEVHRATWAALSPDERKSPVFAAERALSQRHTDGWAANLAGKPCWDAAHNRFVCPDATPYMKPDSHRVAVSLKNVPDAAAIDCTWLTAPHGGRARRGVAITERCDRTLEVDIPYRPARG